MGELIPGGNQVMPEGVLSIRVPGPFDVSALITGDDGRVSGDADFVFFNQPSAPGATLRGDTVTVHPARLRPGASRVTVVVSPSDPGTALGRLPVPAMDVSGGGTVLARFTPQRPTDETVLLMAELYRRGPRWKLRAIGQGYADGLAGIARDFGVDVVDDSSASPPAPAGTVRPGPTPPPAGTAPSRRPAAPPGPAARSGPAAPTPTAVDWPSAAPAADTEGALGPVNSARSRAGVPPAALDGRLSAAAGEHAAAMAAQGRLGVECPAGTSVFHRVAAHGYASLFIAEHIVSGPRTPGDFVDYCLGAPDRSAPLLEPSVVHFGIGRAVGGRSGEVFWTALWARPLTAEGLARLGAEVIALTNAERAGSRLPPLAPDPRLAVAAQAHSADMVARDFYSHTSPEGRQPWDRAAAAGAGHRGIGENIACGQRTPAEVVLGWMNSPGHRANILKPDFTHIGIGYATGSGAGTYWTQLFGSR